MIHAERGTSERGLRQKEDRNTGERVIYCEDRGERSEGKYNLEGNLERKCKKVGNGWGYHS